MSKNYPIYFKACSIINEGLDNANCTHSADYTGQLEQEIRTRFSAFDNMKEAFQLFSN
jgi:hypothetical protein